MYVIYVVSELKNPSLAADRFFLDRNLKQSVLGIENKNSQKPKKGSVLMKAKKGVSGAICILLSEVYRARVVILFSPNHDANVNVDTSHKSYFYHNFDVRRQK